MKKLLTAAVASTFAFLAMGVVNGDEINQGADFEASDFVSGEAFNAALDDEAGAYGDKFWYTEDTEADNIISNYPSTGTGVPIASRPDKFASNSNSKYLRVETTGKLWRSVKNNGGSSDFLTNTTASLDVYGYSITNSAIYLDTLVKFTPADGEFAADALSDGDKIAISYVEHEADTDGDVSYTNFVIRAGLIVGQQLFQTNYFAYLPEDPTFASFDKDAWHRLTVRTIPDVGDGSVGFVVYVDETPLAYSADVDAGFGTLNATAQGFYDNTKHALFPSAREAGAIGGKTISAASFSGNGSLDDVVFTTTTPGFIASSESIAATITLGTGISGVTVSVAGDPVAPVDATASPLVFNLAPGTTDFTLVVTADTANGYTFDAATGITAENASYDNGTVTISGGGAPALTVVGTRDNAYYVDGGVTNGFATLSAAFTSAPDGSTIKLAYDYTMGASEASGFRTYVFADKSLVLDLNGKVLDGGSSNDYYLFAPGEDGELTVIDSGTGGKIVYGGTKGIFNGNLGDVFIGSTTLADNGATFDGVLMGTEGWVTLISRGKFSYADNTDNGEFVALPAQLPSGSTVSHVGDYWVVAPQGGGDEDWKDPSEIAKDATAGDTYGITGDLAAADAVELTEWATGVGSVTFANKNTINIDCFLLNIANNSTAQEIQDEKDEFIVNISFDSVTGEPVVTTPDGKTYNGKFKVYGSDDLTTPKASWHEQTDGDTFFYGKLVP